MGSYRNDRDWSDALIPQMTAILTPWMPYLAEIVIAPADQDNKEATDFIISLKGSTIAARIRRPDCKFRDLTIRSRRDNGMKTELAKIREGYASRYFYAWTDSNFTIIAWMLLDIDKARVAGLFDRRWPEIRNRDRETGLPDGTSFISIPVSALYQVKCVIASHKVRTPALPDTIPLTPADGLAGILASVTAVDYDDGWQTEERQNRERDTILAQRELAEMRQWAESHEPA